MSSDNAQLAKLVFGAGFIGIGLSTVYRVANVSKLDQWPKKLDLCMPNMLIAYSTLAIVAGLYHPVETMATLGGTLVWSMALGD